MFDYYYYFFYFIHIHTWSAWKSGEWVVMYMYVSYILWVSIFLLCFYDILLLEFESIPIVWYLFKK
jgi:hypothetical protein